MLALKRWIVGLGLVALILGGCGDDKGDAEKPKRLDVSKLNVISTQEIDLLAGPIRTSAYLAPDGQSFAYANNVALCLYTISGEQQRCIDLEEARLRLDNEMIRWSPDSRHLIVATDFLRQFRDPDIWIADMDTGTLTNLTDDGFADDLFAEGVDQAYIDVGAHFTDDGKRIVFVRYPGDRDLSRGAMIMSMKIDGSDLKQIGTIPINQVFSVLAFDQSPDHKQWAYNYFPNDLDDPDIGTWLVNAKFEKPHMLGVYQVQQDDEVITSPAWWVDFSADGQYLMNYSDLMLGMYGTDYDPKISPIRMFAVKDGQEYMADERYLVRGFAWAPSGHAFAYIVTHRILENENGLYLSAGPGQPGRLVLPGLFLPPTARGRQPLTWASNNTILLGSFPPEKIIIVQLGKEESIPFAADEETAQPD